METEKKQKMTVSNIRNANIANIMQSLIKGKSRMRSELSEENKISVMTVKHIVDDLIADGILEEKVTAGNEVGRKPKALQIREEYGSIVCMNLTSADEISFLIYDIYETLLAKETVEFDPALKYRDNLLQVIGKVKEKLAGLNLQTVGCAVFVPSAYYEDVDLVNYDLIADFKELHMKELFAKELGMENVLIIHDVVAAARAEYEDLPSEMESQFYFYCGYGVGGSFIHKGVTVMGDQLMAGEVGKMTVQTDEKDWDTFENVVSVMALDRKLAANGASQGFGECIQNYREQDGAVKAVIDEAVEVAVTVLYNLLWVYNPGVIVIDSCCPEYAALLAERFAAFTKSLEKKEILIRTEVRQARYDEYHMMRGCFGMVRGAWVDGIAAS